jgi:hypothetical protein
LARDVASDLGDSLYYMWAIAWDYEQLLAILGGDLTRVRTFFNANIFHPEPLGLTYSDHMIAQAAQVVPLYALTDNLILCYNLLFLSTFVLCGLGTYLFVRELTGNARARSVRDRRFVRTGRARRIRPARDGSPAVGDGSTRRGRSWIPGRGERAAFFRQSLGAARAASAPC